jgi:hypothetical protein
MSEASKRHESQAAQSSAQRATQRTAQRAARLAARQAAQLAEKLARNPAGCVASVEARCSELSTASRSIPTLRNLPCFVKRKRAPHAVQPNDYVV